MKFHLKHENFRFIFYKLDKETSSTNAILKNGSAFMYMDVNNPTWQFPSISMHEQNHAVYYTLKQYYDNKANTAVSVVLVSIQKIPQKGSP